MNALIKNLIIFLSILIILITAYFVWYWFSRVTFDKFVPNSFTLLLTIPSPEKLVTVLDSRVVGAVIGLDDNIKSSYTAYMSFRKLLLKNNNVITRYMLSREVCIVWTSSQLEIPVITVNLGPVAQVLSVLSNTAGMVITGEKDIKIDSYEYAGNRVYLLTILSTNTKWYLTYIKNYVLASQEKVGIQNILSAFGSPDAVLRTNSMFWKVAGQVGDDSVTRVFVNSKYWASGLSRVFDATEIVQTFGLTDIIGIGIKVGDKNVVIKGYNSTRIGEGKQGVGENNAEELMRLVTQKPQKSEVAKVVPDNSSIMMNVRFEDFSVFWNYIIHLSEREPGFKKQVDDVDAKLKQLSGKGLQEGFLSWIGNEVTVVQIPSEYIRGVSTGKQVVMFECRREDSAVEALGKFEEGITGRFYLSVKPVEYADYKIYKIRESPVLRVLLGIFVKVNVELYYTVVKNYLVFSEDLEAVKSVIDGFHGNYVLDNLNSYKNVVSDTATNFVVYYNYASTDFPEIVNNNKLSGKFLKSFPVGSVEAKFVDNGLSFTITAQVVE
ncbi:MAG: DUF3352 domain-containing protein [Elusimicrobiota bacterium]